jgi:isoamylase
MYTRVWPGKPYPLGATWDGSGVNFSLYSENATKVELCFFDTAEARAESVRIALPSVTNQVVYGYPRGAENAIGFDARDSAPFAPLACVIETAFTWGDDHPLRIPWHETVVYETHVKGFTKRHPDVPEELRGTYAGLASPAAIQYLRDLGVTAVELLPIHYHIDEHFLIEKGLVNYWGYNTLGYFAPDPRYSANGPKRAAQEFKSMVRTLHAEGFEVMLDVVYNHTAEADHRGPTLSMRGIDNVAYYPSGRRSQSLC